jgi:hypothetical protein
MIAIVRSEAAAAQVPGMLAFTLAEVAIAVEAFGQATLEAKRVFPGATVTAVRNRGQESKAASVTENRGHKETPTTTPKAKPLAPSGSYQSLPKKMPKDTRYRGESYPASNIKARYEEHMAKQRGGGNQP